MYRLLEIVYADKESVAFYPTSAQEPFTTELELKAEFETKLGADMKADAYKAGYLLAFDDEGNIISFKYFNKDESIGLSPRLITVTTTLDGVVPNQTKQDNIIKLEGEYHSKRGAAMKNPDVVSLLSITFDGKMVRANDLWVNPNPPQPETEKVPEEEPEVVEPTEPTEPTE